MTAGFVGGWKCLQLLRQCAPLHRHHINIIINPPLVDKRLVDLLHRAEIFLNGKGSRTLATEQMKHEPERMEDYYLSSCPPHPMGIQIIITKSHRSVRRNTVSHGLMGWWMNTPMRNCAHKHTHSHMQAHAHTHIHTHMQAHAHTHTCKRTHVSAHTHTHTEWIICIPNACVSQHVMGGGGCTWGAAGHRDAH